MSIALLRVASKRDRQTSSDRDGGKPPPPAIERYALGVLAKPHSQRTARLVYSFEPGMLVEVWTTTGIGQEGESGLPFPKSTKILQSLCYAMMLYGIPAGVCAPVVLPLAPVF
jgi:hypothetical protein